MWLSKKNDPNASEPNAVSVWIGSVCGFLLDWFGFEHPYAT